MGKFSALIIWRVMLNLHQTEEESIALPRYMNDNEISMIVRILVIDYGPALRGSGRR